MFNPIKDTCLHEAINFNLSTQALAVTRTLNLKDSTPFKNESACPAMFRLITKQEFDMEKVYLLLSETLKNEISYIEPYY